MNAYFKVGLLGSYCNREKETEQILALIRQAQSDHRGAAHSPASSRGSRKVSPHSRAEIGAEYEAGVGVVEIARRRGTAKSTVIEQLNRARVVRRSRSMSLDQIEDAEALYRSGLSLQKISDRLGYTARTVRARLLERGVPMRDTQGRDR